MTKQLISNAALERALKQTRTIPIQATNVSFSVEVPGGGDYSNMNLSIGQGGDDTPLQVQYDLPAPGCHACALHNARMTGYATQNTETGPLAPGLR